MAHLLAQGEKTTATIMENLDSATDSAKDLTCCLYYACGQKKYSKAAHDYHALIQSWPEILFLTRETISQQTPLNCRDEIA